MPLYNEVVWAKIGAYRWWPALVVPPEKLPNKIEMLPHQVIFNIFSRNKLFANFFLIENFLNQVLEKSYDLYYF